MITDSFHGMVFSIIFHKPFVVSVNLARGADRFINLLDALSLSSRLIVEENCLDLQIQEPIDWNLIDKKIEKIRIESFKFLKKYFS